MNFLRRRHWVSVTLVCAPLLACDSDNLTCGEGTVRTGDVCVAQSADGGSEAKGAFEGGLDAAALDGASESAFDGGVDVDAGPTAMGVTEGRPDGGASVDAAASTEADASTERTDAAAPSQADASLAGATADAGAPPVATDGKHKLLVSDDGIAFVQTANTRALARSVRVIDNLGLSTAWVAQADQSWLTLHATAAPGELSLEADPTGLALDTMHYANVTLRSTDASVEETESIRVGLWVASTSDAAKVDLGVNPAARGLATDPIRPFVYVHAGGPDIDVYNVHTGERVRTFTDVAPQIGSLTPSSDGHWLYVADPELRIVPINLDDGTKGTPWVLGKRPEGLAYTRSNGKQLVISSAAGVRDAETGEKLADTGEGGAIAASQDGTRYCMINLGLSPYTFYCHTLAFSDVSGVKLGRTQTNDTFGSSFGSNGQDIALSPDGSRIYVASGAPYEFDVFSADTFRVVQVLEGEAYPTNVDVLEDGRVLCGANSAYDPLDAWLYDSRGALKNTYRLGGYTGSLMANTLKASGDVTRVVGISDEFSRPENPSLHIRALDP